MNWNKIGTALRPIQCWIFVPDVVTMYLFAVSREKQSQTFLNFYHTSFSLQDYTCPRCESGFIEEIE